MNNVPLFASLAGNIGGVIGMAWLALKLVASRGDVDALEEVRVGLLAHIAELREDAGLGAQVRAQREAALGKARAANAARKAG